MATTRFNGASVTITTAASAEIASGVGITSFSYEGGDRAEIDITTSSAASREVIAGFRSPRRLSLGLLLDAPTLANLEAMQDECGAGTVAVSAGVDCGTPAQLLSLTAFLMNYSISAQMDGVFEVNVDFMVDERPSS